MKQRALLLLALLAFACGGTNAPAPVPAPSEAPTGPTQYLIDPRIGFEPVPAPAVAKRFDTAWRAFLGGDLATARKRFADIANYPPARLAEAAIDISEQKLDSARTVVDRWLARVPNWTAAQVYAGEIALAEHHLQRAYELYGSAISHPDAPEMLRKRYADIQQQLFADLVTRARTAPDPEALRLLGEALTINPSAFEPRMALVQKMIAARSYDEARKMLDPVLSTNDANRPEVQEALAEIDAGQGRLQDAIARFERLARRDPRYQKRVDDLKELFAAENMPPQYRRAMEDEAITRADFAVLLYWKLVSVRFAQNLPAPPIAIDVSEVPGRDEVIRAIALGILPVDAVTRRVSPNAILTATQLSRLGARVLARFGAPCVKQAATNDADRILAACSVTDPIVGTTPEAAVSGKTAALMLQQIDAAIPK